MLITAGANPDLVAGDAAPPFQGAVLNDHEDLVGMLLDKGCSSNTIFPDGSGALHCAV